MDQPREKSTQIGYLTMPCGVVMIGSVDKPSTKAKEQKPKVNSAKAYH
jgi:hypothetical protein